MAVAAVVVLIIAVELGKLSHMMTAASGRSPALPCLAAYLVLLRFSGLFAFTQFLFQTLTIEGFESP